MGNSPLTVCIHQAWEKQSVQVVLPDGQVLFMPHPLTVSMLMEAHPRHFVCQGSPSLLEQRLPVDTKLESGEIYYLLPVPQYLPSCNTAHDPGAFFPRFCDSPVPMQATANSRKLGFAENVPMPTTYKPPPLLYDKSSSSSSSFSDYARLNLKPQQCLINLFVFRQSVASIMPAPAEESPSFKGPAEPQGGGTGGDHIYTNSHAPSIGNKYPRFEVKHRGVRGRKQVTAWKPHLESISETKPVHDFCPKKNYIDNDFSVSMISSGMKASFAPFAPGSPLHSLLFPREEEQKIDVIQVPLHEGHDIPSRHRFNLFGMRSGQSESRAQHCRGGTSSIYSA